MIAARRARTCAMLTALSESLGKDLYSFTRLSDAVSMIEALQKRSVRSTPTTSRGRCLFPDPETQSGEEL